LFTCFSFFDFAKVTKKEICWKNACIFGRQKKTKISSYSPFFSQNIRKIDAKEKKSKN